MNKLVIPNGTTIIQSLRTSCSMRLNNFFYVDLDKYKDVEEIYMPDTVFYIADEAFKGFTNLKFVRLSNNLRYFGKNVFHDCKELHAIYVPSSILMYTGPFVHNITGNKILTQLNWIDFQLCANGPGSNVGNNITVEYNISRDTISSKNLYREYVDDNSNYFKEELDKNNLTLNEAVNIDHIEVLKYIESILSNTNKLKILNKAKEALKELNNNTAKIQEAKKTVQDIKDYDLDMDWENYYDDKEEIDGLYASDVTEGLYLSLRNKGCVDIEYISAITNLEMKEIIDKLKGSIYQDPLSFDNTFYKGFKTSDEYLSGNIINKLKVAKEYNELYEGLFQNNIDALSKLVPKQIDLNDIYFTMASSWIPKEIILNYLSELLNIPNRLMKDAIEFNDNNSTWTIHKIATDSTTWNVTNAYSTTNVPLHRMVEKVLNLSDLTVYDTLKDASNKKIKIINEGNTAMAIEKAKALNDNFISYCKNRSEVIKLIENAYNEKYAYNITRKYNGEFLTFPGLDPSITLFDYQKNAVARILLSPNNVLLAHDVGTGKTYIIISSIMEMRRTKSSLKNMIVVPNNIVGQWTNMFKSLYPSSNVLSIDPTNFTKAKRNEYLAKIRDEDYDAIIIAQSSFNMIKYDRTNDKLEIEKELKDAIDKGYKPDSTKVKRILAKLNKILKEEDPNDILFDTLEIDSLFVDEAHTYKNITIQSGVGNYELNKAGSDICNDMFTKVRIVEKRNKGKVVFATGTPITNSLCDCYVMEKYLQDGELQLLEIKQFVDWISTFAEMSESIEVDVDTNSYRTKTRFNKFHNLPELTSLLSNIADFYQLEEINDLPIFNGYQNILIPKYKEFEDYLKIISKRADDVRHKKVSSKIDNLLKITTDGRKAALDLRLIDYETYKLNMNGKVYYCAKEVADIYYKYNADKLTQVIFLDQSVSNQTKFNLYDELKALLVLNYKIPVEEIAFAGEATNDSERELMFKKVREGEIRIIIGSTQKLGTGVNIQDKLIACHHLDVPWRPSDLTQREGRIIRQGNTNKEVFIYRYITEGSFDAYSWQILEIKQDFINGILSNSLSERVKEDIEELALDYATIKALAIGNQKIKERATIQNELNSYILKQKRYKDEYIYQQKQLLELPNVIKNIEDNLKAFNEDIDRYNSNLTSYSKEEKADIRTIIFNGLNSHIAQKEDKYLLTYQGFDIYAPKRMLSSNLKVLLVGTKKHEVSLPKELGIIARIDNFLDSLESQRDKVKTDLESKKNTLKSINESLNNKVDYASKISELKEKLEQIDKELNIK